MERASTVVAAHDAMTLDFRPADPIFILGILPRSGTNFLWDLLLLHPHVERARAPINEDLFLDRSDHLIAFVHAVRESWDPMWGDFDDKLMRDFHASLGDGLLSLLSVDRARRLLTKSPSVHNLDRFFRFFPGAQLLVLVRDGRSVVQSCMSTFGWHFERAARLWADGAREIEHFESSPETPKDRYRIIRYEDLLDDLEPTLSSVLDFLDLDGALYDFEAAAGLPVRGSSFYHGAGKDTVHWDPVEKGKDFNPSRQWRGWSSDMHDRLDWIAGAQMRYLGYRDIARPASARRRVLHRALDAAWTTRTGSRELASRARRKAKTATRALRERLGPGRTERSI